LEDPVQHDLAEQAVEQLAGSACRASAGRPAAAVSSGRPSKNCMTSTCSPQ